LDYALALELGRGYMIALEKIVLLLMHKSVRIWILLPVVAAHIDARKVGYHTVLLD
jgi:hypothetical protein